MTYIIRRPEVSDKLAIDTLLNEDYGRLGIAKTAISQVQLERYTQDGWTGINNDSGALEALAVTGRWREGDEAQYSAWTRTGCMVLGRLGLYNFPTEDTGVFVLSAKEYSEGGALSELADETGILDPREGEAIHVPVVLKDEQLAHFLWGRGFVAGRVAKVPLIDSAGSNRKVRTILMTKRAG